MCCIYYIDQESQDFIFHTQYNRTLHCYVILYSITFQSFSEIYSIQMPRFLNSDYLFPYVVFHFI